MCVCVQVRRHCVSQVNLAGKNLVDYDYKDVEYMAKVRHNGKAMGKVYPI